MRRQSLAEEIKDTNVAYADSRIAAVLNGLPDKARHDIMGEYERRNSRSYSSQQQQSAISRERYLLGLAKVIDSFFERNSQGNGVNLVSGNVNVRALNQTLNNPTSQSQPPQPYHVSALSPSSSTNSLKHKPVPQAGISSPTHMAPHLVSDAGVGEYRFIRTLGKGTFGKVKLAEHNSTKEQVSFILFYLHIVSSSCHDIFFNVVGRH